MNRNRFIAILTLFVIISCNKNTGIKTFELNFKNMIQIVNYDNPRLCSQGSNIFVMSSKVLL